MKKMKEMFQQMIKKKTINEDSEYSEKQDEDYYNNLSIPYVI